MATEWRQLGNAGLRWPVLTLGTGTFGGAGEFFKGFGQSDVSEARRLVDVCLEHGVTAFDSADVYSSGTAESILGEALLGRRERVLISTKGSFRVGPGANDTGSSRSHLTRAVEASLRRLKTDHIDLYQLHGFDAKTPVEEVLATLDDLVRAGKIRYIGASNFPGWQLMKSLAASDRRGWARYVAHQAYYSLVGRDFEHELMALAVDQGVGTIVWSPLGWERLTGKIRRGGARPEVSRLNHPATMGGGPEVAEDHLYRVVDALEAVGAEVGARVPQVALAWLLTRPSVTSVIIGARTEDQLRQNLASLDVKLSPEQLQTLDAASATPLPYPRWHQRQYERNGHPLG